MKKIYLIMAALLALSLSGCQKNGATDITDYQKLLSKTQKIEVISSKTAEITATLTEKEDIEAFVTALAPDTWTAEALSETAPPETALPSTAEEIGTFTLSQEKTIQAGQTEADDTLYDVCQITLYDNSYVAVEVSGFSMTFKVNEETETYLREYFLQKNKPK